LNKYKRSLFKDKFSFITFAYKMRSVDSIKAQTKENEK
tara:strand:- start:1449 stop:1562 length:114 start_codon:yes stop_codon:yes gene_type:complete